MTALLRATVQLFLFVVVLAGLNTCMLETVFGESREASHHCPVDGREESHGEPCEAALNLPSAGFSTEAAPLRSSDDLPTHPRVSSVLASILSSTGCSTAWAIARRCGVRTGAHRSVAASLHRAPNAPPSSLHVHRS
jgi:hypothetical protein